MSLRRPPALILALVLATLVGAPVLPALAGETLLEPGHITEDDVIGALFTGARAQPSCDGAASGACRGFGPMPPARPVKPNAGKAGLLITFPTDSAELTGEAMATLDVVARALQSDTLIGERFRIEGHADPRGTEEHNLRLSQARADAVSRYLVTVRAVLPQRLDALGKGSAEPVNLDRPDAPENRRVTVVAVPGS